MSFNKPLYFMRTAAVSGCGEALIRGMTRGRGAEAKEIEVEEEEDEEEEQEERNEAKKKSF